MLRPFVIVITEDQRIESQMVYDYYIYVNAKFDYEIGTFVPRFFLCVMPLLGCFSGILKLPLCYKGCVRHNISCNGS